jgi:hypothetical protein
MRKEGCRSAAIWGWLACGSGAGDLEAHPASAIAHDSAERAISVRTSAAGGRNADRDGARDGVIVESRKPAAQWARPAVAMVVFP